MTHRFAVHVYYEDTDMGGIVYYANYLRYIERARSDWVRGLGVDQLAMKAQGTVFAVARVEADYLQPARLHDDLTVETGVLRVSAARLVMDQRVLRGATEIFRATVTVVALAASGQPMRLPAVIRQRLRHAEGKALP